MVDSAAGEHRTVRRVTTILEAAGDSPEGIRLAALARRLEAPKSSVHSLLRGLVAAGYLDERDGGYVLGPAIGTLLLPAGSGSHVSARRALEELQRFSGESAMYCRLVGDSVVYTDIVESAQLIRYAAPLRERRPLYPTSAGKCFLAHFSPNRLASYLVGHVAASSRTAVEAELAAVRRDGVAFNRGETVPDVYAAASPITSGSRGVIACLAVAGPHVRVEPKLPEIAAKLREQAGRLAPGRS